MQQFKYHNLREELGGAPIPIVEVPRESFIKQLCFSLSIPVVLHEVEMSRLIYAELSRVVSKGPEADDLKFDLLAFLNQRGLPLPANVYHYWSLGEPVDKADLEFVCRHLNEIWYPGPDDLDICDEHFR